MAYTGLSQFASAPRRPVPGLGLGLPARRPAPAPTSPGGLLQHRPGSEYNSLPGANGNAQTLPYYGKPNPTPTPIPNHVPGDGLQHQQLLGQPSPGLPLHRPAPPNYPSLGGMTPAGQYPRLPHPADLRDQQRFDETGVHPARTAAHEEYDRARDLRMQQADSYSEGLQAAQAAPYTRNKAVYDSMAAPRTGYMAGLGDPNRSVSQFHTGGQSTFGRSLIEARGQNMGSGVNDLPDNAAPAPKPQPLPNTEGGSGPNGQRMTMGGPTVWMDSKGTKQGIRGPSIPKFSEGNVFAGANGMPITVSYDKDRGNLQYKGLPKPGYLPSGQNGMVREAATGKLVRDPGLAKSDQLAANRKQADADAKILQRGVKSPMLRASPAYQDAQARMRAKSEVFASAARRGQMAEEMERRAHDLRMEQFEREYKGAGSNAERNHIVNKYTLPTKPPIPTGPGGLPTKPPAEWGAEYGPYFQSMLDLIQRYTIGAGGHGVASP